MADDFTGRSSQDQALEAECRRFAATVMEERLPGVGALLKQALGGGINPERVFLVRWEAFRASVGGGWEALRGAFVDALSRTIEQETGGGIILPFDADGLLVIVDKTGRTLSAVSTAVIGTALGDRWPDTRVHALEIWAAGEIDEGGLSFKRLDGAETVERGPSAETAGQHPLRLVLTDTDFAFFPIWDVAANHVMAHLCRPSWAGPNGITLTEDSPQLFAAAPEQVAAIDAVLFEAAIRLVRDALDHYGAISVIVPVHSILFDDEAAASGYFRAVDQEIWPFVENIMFELLCGQPLDDRRETAAIERLAGYGSPPMVRLSWPTDISDGTLPADLWSIGFDFSRWGETADADALFAGFREQASNLGHRCHVIGLSSTPETVAAVNAGFDFVGSDAIAPPLAGPDARGAETAPADILKSILAAQAKS